MKIAAITKFKNGVLSEILDKSGGTIKDLSDQWKLNYVRLVDCFNLRRKPWEKELPLYAEMLCHYGYSILDAFPDYFVGIKKGKMPKVVQIEEMAPEQLTRLADSQPHFMLESNHSRLDSSMRRPLSASWVSCSGATSSICTTLGDLPFLIPTK